MINPAPEAGNTGVINVGTQLTATINNAVSGTGQKLVKIGTGNLILGGVNTYDGGTTVKGGLIRFSNANNFGSGWITLDGGGLQWAANNTADISVQLNPLGTDGGIFDTNGNNVTLASNVIGTGRLTKNGAGTLTLTGTNTYRGGVTVNGGRLLGNAASLIGNIVNNAAVTFAQNSAGTYSGSMSGTGELEKSGNGELTVTGSISHSGGTRVSGGTLHLDSASLSGSGTVTVAVGAELSGRGAITGPATISGTLSPGSGAHTYGKLTFTSGLILTDSTLARFNLGSDGQAGADYDSIRVSGGKLLLAGSLDVQALSAGTYALFDYNGALYNGEISSAFAAVSATLNGSSSNWVLNNNTSGSLITLTLILDGQTGQVWTGNGTDSTWSASQDGWKDGSQASNQAGQVVTFNGAGETITVDGQGSAMSFDTLHFATDGFTLTGNALQINTGDNTRNSGTIHVADGHTAVIKNIIEGTGQGLLKVGEGTLILNGVNTYDGGTTVNGGILSGDASSLSGNIVNNAKINFNQTNDGTYAGEISGIGGLYKTGDGTLTLNHANTHSGGNMVGEGILKAGTDSVLGTGAYQISSGAKVDLNGTRQIISGLSGFGEISLGSGSLTINQDVNSVYEGSISGSGSFTKSGAGMLVLFGSNSYEGGTTVTDGILAGDTGSLQGTIINNSTVLFAQSFDDVFAGTLSGTGTLQKSGTGALIVNGSGNSAGTVSINEGRLLIGDSKERSASLLSANTVNVYDNALLGGHGNVNADVIIHAGGHFSPGNSYGTTTVNGNLTFSPDSLFDVEVNSNNINEGDKIIVNGTATLAGIVRHLSTGGTAGDYAAPGKEWQILSATAISGTFDDAVSNLAFLLPQLRYGANEVFLSFIRGASFSDYADTRNQRSLAGALQSLHPAGSLYQELLGNATSDQAQRLLDELSGEVHATLKSNLFMLDKRFMRNLARHASQDALYRSTIRPARADENAGGAARSIDDARLLAGNNLWVAMDYSYNSMDGDNNAGRSVMYGTEVSGGYDAEFVNGWLGGLAFRFSSKQMDVDTRRSTADIKSYTAALYGGKEFHLGPGSLRFVLTGALTKHDIESERKVFIGTSKQALEAEYGGDSFQTSLETAYVLPLTDRLYLEPFASLGWHSLRLDGFSENGGNAALHNDEESWSHTLSTLGLRASLPIHERVSLNAEIGWQHIYGDDAPKASLAFREGSDKYTIRGITMDRDEAIAGLGVELKLTDTVRFSLNYDGAWGSRAQGHAGQATFEWRW